MVTLDQLPALDGTSHTIFGRLVSGRETVSQIEGIDEFKAIKRQIANQEGKAPPTKIYVKNAGVYKFE